MIFGPAELAMLGGILVIAIIVIVATWGRPPKH
jgi:hypothetical protein